MGARGRGEARRRGGGRERRGAEKRQRHGPVQARPDQGDDHEVPHGGLRGRPQVRDHRRGHRLPLQGQAGHQPVRGGGRPLALRRGHLVRRLHVRQPRVHRVPPGHRRLLQELLPRRLHLGPLLPVRGRRRVHLQRRHHRERGGELHVPRVQVLRRELPRRRPRDEEDDRQLGALLREDHPRAQAGHLEGRREHVPAAEGRWPLALPVRHRVQGQVRAPQDARLALHPAQADPRGPQRRQEPEVAPDRARHRLRLRLARKRQNHQQGRAGVPRGEQRENHRLQQLGVRPGDPRDPQLHRPQRPGAAQHIGSSIR